MAFRLTWKTSVSSVDNTANSLIDTQTRINYIARGGQATKNGTKLLLSLVKKCGGIFQYFNYFDFVGSFNDNLFHKWRIYSYLTYGAYM